MTANPLAPAWLAPPADAGALEPGLWPATASRDAVGALTVGGVAATELAAQFGTPLYVVDEADFRTRARAARAAFEDAFARHGGTARVYYAGKAFLSAEISRWVAEEGLGIDVASGGELAVAHAAGVDPARFGFHGNNKSPAEIDRAVSIGVGTIILDSVQEVERVADAATRHGRVQPVRLRVNSGVHAHTHEYLATAHEDQKFGVPLADAAGVVEDLRSRPSLRFLGLHCHIGSQIFDADGFAESSSRLLAVHAELLEGGDVPELNLGGGFGIAYTPADDPMPLETLARRIADAVAAECARRGIRLPLVAFEPGRSIAGTPGITLYTVGTIKDVRVSVPEDGTAVRRYVSVDGGMSDNARPALYGADYTVRLAGRGSDAEHVLVRVAGKHCESGDIVVDAGYLPDDVVAGDLVAVAATGAYCWSLSSNYNYLARPPVVAVRDGRARIIVRGVTEAELLAHDAALEPEAQAASGLPRATDAPGRRNGGIE